MKNLRTILTIVFALVFTSTALASNYPDKKASEAAWLKVANDHCGDGTTVKCGGHFAANCTLLLNTTDQRSCAGGYVEKTFHFPTAKTRVCTFNGGSVIQTTSGPMVIGYSDTCHNRKK